MPDGSFGGVRAPAFPRRTATILSDVRRAISLLEQSGDPAASTIADALGLFVHGAPLERALGLRANWQDHAPGNRRETALVALAAAQPADMSYRDRARKIAASIRLYGPVYERDHAAQMRPDGLRGHLYDYLETSGPRSEESIRRLLPGLVQDNG